MSEERSPRLALPLLQPGQAQKEQNHNEALARLDLAFQRAPGEGQCWIVGATPTGDWSGRAGTLAGWTAGGWRYIAPVEGMVAWSLADRLLLRFDAGQWRAGEARATRLIVDGEQVVGAQRAAVPDPAGGATVDGEARSALLQVLAALRGHGLIA